MIETPVSLYKRGMCLCYNCGKVHSLDYKYCEDCHCKIIVFIKKSVMKNDLMKKPKLYISGKISGIEERAALVFRGIQETLEKEGFEAVNPMALPHQHDHEWSSYMKEDIKALMDCDGIYLLNNWNLSDGAIIERNLAQKLKMPIYNNITDAKNDFGLSKKVPQV